MGDELGEAIRAGKVTVRRDMMISPAQLTVPIDYRAPTWANGAAWFSAGSRQLSPRQGGHDHGTLTQFQKTLAKEHAGMFFLDVPRIHPALHPQGSGGSGVRRWR